MDQGDRLLD